MKIMDELSLSPKYVMRKGNHIIYFKDSESIEDFLAYIGAQNSSLYMIGIKIEKDVKNTVNRKLNFELCNIEKTVNASNRQIESILKIKNTVGLNSLPDNLREIAELRLENPETSLSELVELYEGSISKSGMKHRIDRIMEISDNL
jgi:DNA-binding protein WhiA